MARSRSWVCEGDKGERLDRYVARLAAVTRSQAQRLISEGGVRVNGEVPDKNHRLQAGECVEVEQAARDIPEPAPQSIAVNILFEDGDIAVISKPAGMVVHPAAGHNEGTLVNALLYALDGLSGVGGELRPGIVHRLDRDTSGLMVVAKNDPTHLRLQETVRDRSMRRMYLALIHGVPKTRLGTVDAPVGRDPRERKRMAVNADSGKPSLTHFRVLREFAESSLLEVELETGRTHQIRVHLAFIGHPVAGDREYGRRGALEDRLGLKRQFLHAYKLSFPHPSSGEELAFEDPLPEDLECALGLLRAP